MYLYLAVFIYQITLTFATLLFQYKNMFLFHFAILNVNDLDITFLNVDHNILLVKNVMNLMTQKIVLLMLLSNVQTAVLKIQLPLRHAQNGKLNKKLIQ